MKKLFLFSIAALAIIMACSASTIGEQTTQTRAAAGYTGINAGQGIKVNIAMGDSEKVEVTAPDDIIGKLVTEVKSGTLFIHWERKTNIKSTRLAEVNVTVKELQRIIASSGTTINADSIQSHDFMVEASSGSQVNMTINAQSVKANSSSGSSIGISGKCQRTEFSASSGSSIKAKELESADGVATSSSGSSICINAAVTLQAKSSSGASIRYVGSPTITEITASSGGTIKRD